MTPSRIALGPEKSKLIQQNRTPGAARDRHRRAAHVVFVSRQPDPDSTPSSRSAAPKDATSGLLVANGNGSYQTALPTGLYTVSAADIPGAKPAKLVVGPYRASSQNDVLLP